MRGIRVVRRGVLIGLAVCSIGTCSAAAATPTPADRAATHAYLLARYRYDVALVKQAIDSRAGAIASIGALGRECHGVLSGVPKEPSLLQDAEVPPPRARGERKRAEEQRSTIESELTFVGVEALFQLTGAASEAFANEVIPLRWSDARIAPLVAERVSALRQQPTRSPQQVCADMKAWVASGYRRLSPGAREFQAARQASEEKQEAAASLDSLIKPSEGPAETALIRRSQRLSIKLLGAFAGTFHELIALRRELGLPVPSTERSRHEPVVGRGRTLAGLRFVVRRELAGGSRGGCHARVQVDFTSRGRGGGSLLGFGFDSSTCVSGRVDRGPSSDCGGSFQTITLVVAPRVRSVRLVLSDGRTVTSRVILVRGRHGAYGGVYAQAVRARRPYPVSLTELDAHGQAVRVVPVPAADRCRTHPVPEGPTFVDLVSGTTPAGTPFTVQGAFIRFGRHHTNFSVNVSAGVEQGYAEETIEQKPKAYQWSLAHECPPHEFSIVYGLLAAPGDSVLARTPTGLVALTKVAIAAHLHSIGPLVYGVFTALPSELVVRRGDGSVLYTESLAAKAKEEAEFCEGYAEPSG